MSTPGPMISGFRIPGLAVFGPLDEKVATFGASGSDVAPLNKIVDVGVEVKFNILSVVLAPTVRIHGASFDKEPW
ncbi:unnamed protein product [Prunus armeniaca]|uniref:Uncharacterized protein n=1 Tax=Prunus armeniaca TaxID=36596 RepID=A0A6J5XCH9_PRUAR|nr:unnamed protein product [Prunus armeniaca]CAB4310193.1 unnamed protein product [Prunus armeniaca]